eukprot:238647_1
MKINVVMMISILTYYGAVTTPYPNDKIIIYIHEMSVSPDDAQAVRIPHQLAVDAINNNPYLLKNYELRLIQRDSMVIDRKGLEFSREIIQSFFTCSIEGNNDSNFLISPILLEPTWSSTAIPLSQLFKSFDLLHIGSCATSTKLTAKDHSAFFRTIMSDKYQGQAIAKLCKYYNWNRIGYVSMDDLRTDSLAVIQQYSQDNVEIKHVSYKENDIESIRKAAKYIVDNKLYVTVLNMRGDHLETLFKELETINGTIDPYFYIGTDITWFDEGIVKTYNISEYLDGYISTIPGTPFMVTKDEYLSFDESSDAEEIYKIATEINIELQDKWHEYHAKHTGFNNAWHNYIPYAYDSVWALAHALDIFDNKYGLSEYLSGCDTKLRQFAVEKLREILIQNMFYGATGAVSFDDNGNRVGGLIVVANVNNDRNMSDKIQYVGMASNHGFVMYDNKLKWKHGHIAKTDLVMDKQVDIGVWNETDVEIYFIAFGIFTLVLTCTMNISIFCAVYYKRKWKNAQDINQASYGEVKEVEETNEGSYGEERSLFPHELNSENINVKIHRN